MKNKKKILFVTKALWIGGIETALVNLLNYIDYEKYDVSLLVLHAELNMLDRINKNCKVFIIDREQTISFNESYRYSKLFHLTEEAEDPSVIHKLFMSVIPLIKWIENKLYISYVKRLMNNMHFDTAIIYSDVVAETAVKAVNADRFIMFYHHGIMRHVYHDKIGYQRSEKIVAVSDNLANELKEFCPKYKDKIVSIHNITDTQSIIEKSQLPCEDTFDTSCYNVVTVGRVAYEKGIDLAVAACARLVAAGYDNIKWWIVGDGPSMGEVKDLITKTNMQDHIVTVGMKDNPYPYIKQADLYVQPSRAEAYGLTIMEALSLDKIVVSTNTVGARELLSDSYDYLCDINADSLSSKIINAIISSVASNNELEKYESQNDFVLKELENLL